VFFNATLNFSYIVVASLLVEETGVPRENQRPAAMSGIQAHVSGDRHLQKHFRIYFSTTKTCILPYKIFEISSFLLQPQKTTY
jgi:hypothetical protein